MNNLSNAICKLGGLYAHTDAERFPSSQLAEGLERASTLFWADFSVADAYGIKAIQDTFDRCCFENRGYKAITELVIVLNHKIWEWYGRCENAATDSAKKFCAKVRDLYQKYYEKVSAWAEEHLTGDEASFYYRVTD